MTFNLAARQKPKDISPNRITACSSPSSHNFQLDSLTAARSAGSQPATALLHFTPTKSGGNVSPVRKSGPLKKKKKRYLFSDALYYQREAINALGAFTVRTKMQRTSSHIHTINYFNKLY